MPPKDTVLSNINTSAYRVLYILLLMLRQRGVTMPDINRAMHADPVIRRSFNSETLAKYINTLRFLGCDIPRSSSRNDYCYTLASHPFPLHPDEKLLAPARRLLALLQHQPDSRLRNHYHDILERVCWSIGRKPFEELSGTAPDGKVIDVMESRRRLLERYRGYCRDGQMLQVDVAEENHNNVETTRRVVEPTRVTQEGKKLFLLALDTETRQNVKLDLNRIVAANQLPAKTRSANHETTVIYQLYGRLAAGYRLYPGEEVLFRQEETIQLKLRTDDPHTLMARLRKYGTNCQVISPQSLRKRMGEQLTAMQAALSGDTPLSKPSSKKLQSVQNKQA